MSRFLMMVVVLGFMASPLRVAAADAASQADVARRGADVMPFSLAATTHVFTTTAEGGVQRVVVKDASDAGQVALVRAHLHDMQVRFAAGDFAGPAHVHGAVMPGLAELRSAQPGRLKVDFREVDGGAELTFRSADAALVEALHRWFDAQLADHGADAMAAHMHHVGVDSTER
jgi:hypothetical protein